MRSTERKQRLFENIVRLRRAERAMPGDRDIVAVRGSLEQELGETISQRLAARLLGMSHTALSRWIAAGDLPVVYNADGREQVPVAAVLELHETVTAEREAGIRRRHFLEPTMSRARERARRLDPRALMPQPETGDGGHEPASRRSLAYHRALAQRLRRPMVDDALHLIWTWRDQDKIDPRYADRWEQLLQRPLSEIRRGIGEDSSAARELRQTSPFAGALSEAERRKIVAEVR